MCQYVLLLLCIWLTHPLSWMCASYQGYLLPWIISSINLNLILMYGSHEISKKWVGYGWHCVLGISHSFLDHVSVYPYPQIHAWSMLNLSPWCELHNGPRISTNSPEMTEIQSKYYFMCISPIFWLFQIIPELNESAHRLMPMCGHSPALKWLK
jgi:hypothetical protein